MNRLTLRFRDREIERRFSAAELQRSIRAIRVFIVSGVMLYAMFGVLDTYIMPVHYREIWLIRFGIICPTLIAILLSTFTRLFFRIPQVLLSLAMIASGGGILAMIAIAPPPGNYLYYAGLILVVIYCSSMAYLNFPYAISVTTSLFTAYQFIAIFMAKMPLPIFISNEFFFGTSILVGIIWSYMQELHLRKIYINTHLLTEEKVRSERLGREAQAANHAKSEFLATMSHELRTPLNAIIGFAEVMKLQLLGPLGSERYKNYAEDIHNSGMHLLAIINDILDLAKAEANKLTLIDEELDLCEIVDGSIRMFRDQAATQGVRMAFNIPKERPLVRGDLRLLRQVVINLLSNAIKFTLTGGSVSLSIATDADGCRIVVEDTGIGIPHDHLDKILEPFVQVESAHSRKHGGTGLGLPLVKRIVELHGGELKLSSELGVGTRITVHLPADRVIRTSPAALARTA